MNCKQGDLAMFIRVAPNGSVGRNIGRIVTCIDLLLFKRICTPAGIKTFENVWIVRPKLVSWEGKPTPYCPDEWLRPIRDPGDDAQDETLSWKIVPRLNADESAE